MAWGKKKWLVMGEVDDKIRGAKAEEEVVRGGGSGGGKGGGGVGKKWLVMGMPI